MTDLVSWTDEVGDEPLMAFHLYVNIFNVGIPSVMSIKNSTPSTHAWGLRLQYAAPGEATTSGRS